jgi:hypothetical protein
MTSDNAAAERAAFIVPDLRELADRIEVVLAHPWIDRAGFLRDTMGGLRQAVAALPAGPGRLQLADLAARIGRVLADPHVDRERCLRDTRDALAPLAESTAADLRAAADRAAWVAGLRDLADFLAAHPDVPVPPAYHTQSIHVFPDGASDAGRRAEIDRVAAALGVPAAESGAGHYRAARSFGPAEYLAVALPKADQAEDSAAPAPDVAAVAA